MKTPIHLYLVLLTVVVTGMALITGQADKRPMQIIIVLLALLSGIAVIMGRRMSRRNSGENHTKKSHIDFRHRERKSGLTWGGGNIKASEAKRGTRRKFLGK